MDLMAPIASTISNAVVRLMLEHTGRGPTRAHTTITPDVIIVVLRDCLSTSERGLIADGQESAVWAMRRAYGEAMRESMIAIIEQTAGRDVEAFLTDLTLTPDITIEVFLLE